MKLTAAGLLCFSCALVCGQQPAPAPAPVPAPAQAPEQPQPPAPLPRVTDETRNDIDRGGYFQLFYWLSQGSPDLRGGKKAVNPPLQSLTPLAIDNKHTPGLSIGFPAGKFNKLEITVFQSRGSGTTTAPATLSIFGTTFNEGDLMATQFRVRNVSVLWNYLTWPEPPEDAKLRVKTFWGAQYTGVQAVLDEPANFNPSFSPAVATRNIIYPLVGIGAEYNLSKYLYFEARATGFAFPHKSVVGNVEGTAVIRIRKLEVTFGEKWFHFKTSPASDEYIKGTLKGPYGGLRLAFK